MSVIGIASASHLRTRGLSPLLADGLTCVLTFVATAICRSFSALSKDKTRFLDLGLIRVSNPVSYSLDNQKSTHLLRYMLGLSL